MARLTSNRALFTAWGLLAALVAGCSAPTGTLETDDRVLRDDSGVERPDFVGDLVPGPMLDEPEGYVVGPDVVAVFVGEELLVELELLEPDIFQLLPGTLPEDADFTAMPSGALVRWVPQMDDVGTHEFSLFVVDAEEPNLIIAQEMLVVDVLPRYRFIEYGF